MFLGLSAIVFSHLLLWFLSPLSTFNLCLLLQLGEHITSLTSLLWKECEQVLFSAPRQCRFCSVLFLSITQHSFLLVLPHVFYFWQIFFSHILSQITVGPLLLIITSLNIRPLPVSSTLFHLKKKKWHESVLPSFHHFSLLMLPFCPPCGNATIYSFNLSTLLVPFRLLIRRREWNFQTLPISWWTEVSFLREQQ